jgi:nicotinamide mononucleotide transporter
MNLQQWTILLIQQVQQTDLIQWLALLLGVTEVLLARANKIALYPAGIAATALSLWILYEAGLYAECLLNGYYIIMSIYGWWHWVKKKNEPPVKVSYSNRQERMTTFIISIAGTGLLYLALRYFTPSTVPFWDAWVSATAWAGMWLLARRKIENWVLLNISNAFAIPLLFYKGLPLYAALTIFLFIVAIQGYFQWSRIIKQEKQNSWVPGLSQ